MSSKVSRLYLLRLIFSENLEFGIGNAYDMHLKGLSRLGSKWLRKMIVPRLWYLLFSFSLFSVVQNYGLLLSIIFE